MPRRLLLEASDREAAWSCLFCWRALKVWTVDALARDRVAMAQVVLEVMLLLSIGPFKAILEATPNAIVSYA